MMRACILAGLVAVAAAVQADNAAYWSARYGGWSKESFCDRAQAGDRNFQRCRVMTLGKGSGNHEGAALQYICNNEDFEILSISTVPNSPMEADDPTLEAKWDYRTEQGIKTWVEQYHNRKTTYWFHISAPSAFVPKMLAHEFLEVYLPFKHERPYKVKFPLDNAKRAIQRTMRLCGIQQSSLSPELHR